MFRGNKLISLTYNRLVLNRYSSTSTTQTSSSAVVADKSSTEKSLIPEHLRYKPNASFWEKFRQIVDGDNGPLIPCAIIVVGMHIYIGWYLFGGEFESDFEDEEVVHLSNFVANTKKKYAWITSKLSFKGQDSVKHEFNETEDEISS